MRILLTIPSFWPNNYGLNQADSTVVQDETAAGATQQSPEQIEERRQQLSLNIARLHQLFGRDHWTLDLSTGNAAADIERQFWQLDIIIVTPPNNPVLQGLYVPMDLYTLSVTEDSEPEQLATECHTQLARNVSQNYDIYGYLEEDLMLSDALFFDKLKWFSQTALSRGIENAVLVANRVELSAEGPVSKLYIDGQTGLSLADYYQDLNNPPPLTLNVLGKNFQFERAQNPYSGCFFLTTSQMAYWAKQPWFADGDIAYRDAKISGASLGLMKTFALYRPGVSNASFLEVQRTSTPFIDQIVDAMQQSLTLNAQTHEPHSLVRG
jgi:hypothetical protein